MVRAPCCEKMGLKKGPWAPEEDQILISYIQAHGHSNWRALPKQAGLLRCGKSCRLRWTNYLRPDIKRGNFTAEEEDTIFKLHEMLGNRWSAIAARLPGRTDNEIKNVWHTHLKKRLPQNHQTKRNPKQSHSSKCKQHPVITSSIDHVTKVETTEYCSPLSPPQCSSDNTSILTTSDINYNNQHNDTVTTNGMSRNNVGTPTEDNIEALDEDFWSDVLSADDSGDTSNEIPDLGASADQHIQFPYSPLIGTLSVCDGFGMDFWYDVYTRAEGLTQLPEL